MPSGDGSEFTLETLASGSRTHVIVRGQVDLVSADELGASVDAELARGQEVVLDLGRVGFIDSTGVAVLLQTVETAQRNGWKFAIAPGLSPAVRQVFTVTAVLPLLPLAAT
ncbi:MAG TPA: STAS domain-containing protein [Capillimicrobium sp.]|jgi:anti-anti-sigma factor